MPALLPKLELGSIADWFAFAAGITVGAAVLGPAAATVQDAIRKK